MHASPRKLNPGSIVCLLALVVLVPARGLEPERIYSLAEVAVIDRENEMWRLVDAKDSVETNIQRLLGAGFATADVQTLKPRLVAIWETDLGLQLDWMDQTTAAKIKELEPEYSLRMRQARLREEICRLGGTSEPISPDAVRGRWRGEILRLLDDGEIKEFTLMNSPTALALYRLTKDVPLAVAERRTLCLWQQDFEGLKPMILSQSYLSQGQIAARLQEALLDHWQRMRDLLGDARFAIYLHAADSGFGPMTSALSRIAGIDDSKALDLWWVRKRDESADLQAIWGRARYRLKIKAYESAVAVLGSEGIEIYEQNDDAKWLERNNPYQTGMFSQRAYEVERN